MVLVADALRTRGLRRTVYAIGGFEAGVGTGLPTTGIRRSGTAA
jgi:hypothetical protein